MNDQYRRMPRAINRRSRPTFRKVVLKRAAILESLWSVRQASATKIHPRSGAGKRTQLVWQSSIVPDLLCACDCSIRTPSFSCWVTVSDLARARYGSREAAGRTVIVLVHEHWW